LLKASLETPQFEPVGIERLRDDALQTVARAKSDQRTIADDAWFALAFPDHLYGSPGRGTEQGLKTTTVDDLQALWKRIANRRNMHVVVVGDITPANLKVLLDHVFGNIPDKDLVVAEEPTKTAAGPIEKRVVYDNPQTVVTFGYPSTGGNSRDAWAAYLLTEILGGRPGFARLNQTLREKSGLTYGVSMSYNDWEFADIQYGSFSTGTETTEQALQMLRKEFTEMAKSGPTVEELLKVKSYINGSYPLRFSNNDSIAAQLIHKKQRGYSPAYFKERADLVNAVTLEDVKAQAAVLLKPENQIIVVVGRN
jgi:zinc protease